MNWPSIYKGAYLFKIGTRHWNHYQRDNIVFLASKMCLIKTVTELWTRHTLEMESHLKGPFTNPLGVIKGTVYKPFRSYKRDRLQTL